MLKFYLPVAIVVGSNIFYHVSAKGIPSELNPMVGIFVIYLIGAALALGMFFITDPVKDISAQLKIINWAPLVLAFAVIGMEYGNIMLYRAGWNISVGSLVCNIALAAILLFIGILVYKETLNFHQLIGIGLCVAGLIFINK
jgi:drug/metabolite transporter (DMT)-like permease